MRLDAVWLRRWAYQLCLLPADTTQARAARELGIGGADAGDEVWRVEPPPDGCSSLWIEERWGDPLAFVYATPRTVTLGDLDTWLGPGTAVPRVHWDDPLTSAYRTVVAGAPFTCTVFARHRGQTPATAVEQLMLRRDRADAPARPPRLLAVDDLPVRLVSVDGRDGTEALDLGSGAFVRDDTLLERAAAGGPAVEGLSAAAFDRLVFELRREASIARQATAMTWHPTGDAGHPYRAEHDGTVYWLRAGDAPVPPRHTLVVDAQEVDHVDRWPAAWVRSAADEPGGPTQSKLA